ncbi:hypothetical protein CUJ86_08205 [Methanofollis fontis]|uniref:Uncharacterized protein n=2 Tax=Methanofollis fontis TaxID=2052832 RepID=A0A483CM98_9EURY|nr:hypothetical protein CUJ86_08205 [Methanofollis fontis]
MHGVMRGQYPIRWILIIIGAVLAVGCVTTDEGTTISGTGTVRYIDLEGGFYGIVGDDGADYLPLDLDPAFQQDGLRVRYSLEKADVATIQQWGTPVRVVAIERI